MIDLNVLVTLLFGAGAGGAIAGIINVIKTLRSGKIENEETLIKRLDTDNKKQAELRDAAEKRAESAEKEAEEYRKERNNVQEELARLRWEVIQEHGRLPGKFGESNDK